MSWFLRLLLLGGAISVASACGESADLGVEPAGPELTVLVPSGEPGGLGFASAVISVEYTVACESVETEGALSRAGSFEGGPKGTTAVWKGSLSALPGSCVIRFLARDGDDELICDWTEPLRAASDWPSELLFELPCYRYNTCTSAPLPSSAANKSFCISIVGVLLSAETPAPLDRLQRIEYVISELWDTFDNQTEIVETYRGELRAAGSGQIDFGAGPVPTDRWEASIEDVPAVRYLIELTAIDSDGAAICAAERRLQIVAGAVAQIEVAMPCLDAMESPP